MTCHDKVRQPSNSSFDILSLLCSFPFSLLPELFPRQKTLMLKNGIPIQRSCPDAALKYNKSTLQLANLENASKINCPSHLLPFRLHFHSPHLPLHRLKVRSLGYHQVQEA